MKGFNSIQITSKDLHQKILYGVWKARLIIIHCTSGKTLPQPKKKKKNLPLSDTIKKKRGHAEASS